MWGIVSHLI